jgi:hypothetical protein
MSKKEITPEPAGAEQRPKQKRGFALLAPEDLRELARQGGTTSQANGTANRWTSESARVAGRMGGRTISRDREHMRTIGRKGGTGKKGFRRNKPQVVAQPKDSAHE